jgi:hypothetical protein
MFCPKCGSQNLIETKFCRSCGTDLGNLLALIDGRTPEVSAAAEKYIELNSRGLSGTILGVGFLLISAILFSIPPHNGIIWLLPLAFAFFFLSVGLSRFVHARGIRNLGRASEQRALPTAQAEYIKPARTPFETDDLAAVPLSVTEHTTRHLGTASDRED